MLHIVQHSWRQSLAAFTLASVFGSADTVARADTPLAKVAAVGAIQEKDGEKKPVEKPRDEKTTKSPQSLDQLLERLRQLEEENAKLREALGQQKKVKQYGEPRDWQKIDSKELRGWLETEGSHIKTSPEKTQAGEGKKGDDGTTEFERRLKAIQEEIAVLRKAGRIEEAEKLERTAAAMNEHLTRILLGNEQKRAKLLEDQISGLQARQKLEQMAVEVLKLRAAGQKEAAEVLDRELRQFAEKLQDEHDGKWTKEEGQKPGASPSELGRVLQELREEVNRLREEVAELRSIVKEQGRTPKK